MRHWVGLITLCFGLAFTALAESAEVEWQLKDGKTITGRFERVDGNKVCILGKQNGKLMRFKIKADSLSTAGLEQLQEALQGKSVAQSQPKVVSSVQSTAQTDMFSRGLDESKKLEQELAQKQRAQQGSVRDQRQFSPFSSGETTTVSNKPPAIQQMEEFFKGTSIGLIIVLSLVILVVALLVNLIIQSIVTLIVSVILGCNEGFGAALRVNLLRIAYGIVAMVIMFIPMIFLSLLGPLLILVLPVLMIVFVYFVNVRPVVKVLDISTGKGVGFVVIEIALGFALQMAILQGTGLGEKIQEAQRMQMQQMHQMHQSSPAYYNY